jgi:GAF domain-containing protein/anti-sigma regulatory factor (Ser/Thr protein kinase)
VTTVAGGPVRRQATASSRLGGSGLWTRLAACVALACGPLVLALVTEGGWAGEGSRVVFLLAFGLALATGAVLLLRAGDARRAREAAAPERALRQAREQQAATAEILGAMAASPPDLQRVLDTIARNAARVCDGLYALVLRVDGAEIRLAAHHGLSPARLDALNQRYPAGLDDGSLAARAIRDASVVHCPDIPHDPGVPSWLRELAQAEGFRSLVIVPMLGAGRALGTLNVSRPEGAFTERQIQLLRIFADQAVIAIENVRLFQALEARNRELTEALERETATGGILRAIATSPTDPSSVFAAILESTLRLCGATIGSVNLSDGQQVSIAAIQGPAGLLDAVKPAFPRRLTDSGLATRVIREGVVVHVSELLEDHTSLREIDERSGMRAQLFVPMLREGRCIGALTIARSTPGLFSEAQVALMHTLADQAAIAVENVRLFQELEARNRELTESLEQQTATGAILRVISGSPTDIQPVLDAVAESATRLCEARDVSIALVDQHVLRVVASHGPLARWWPDEGIPLSRGSVTGRAVVERQTIHIHDLASESELEYPEGKAYQRQGGHRTNMAVPLVREGVAIGVIAVRREEVRPFTDRQIGLLETFADQAVIAIENVRLFQELAGRNRDLTEALEQQTATGEILRVISSSPPNLAPVMDAVARNATRLARADHALIGEASEGRIRWLATSGCPLVSEGPPISRQLPSGRAILDCQTTQVEDVTELTEDFPGVRRAYDEFGVRTILATPLVREGLAIGVLLVRRTTMRSFTGKEIELLRTFADQAVIAIENVRLFQELQARNRDLTEALEQQTATGEILRVISSSPTDVQPTFDAIAASATSLCEALQGSVFRFDGTLIHLAAHYGHDPIHHEALRGTFPIRPGRGSMTARAILTRSVVHADVATDPKHEYDALTRGGASRVLAVPMLRDGTPIGAITVSRDQGRPFSDSQLALLRTFADQAVIAIENVRLFQELEARNRDLTESLEQQTATAEILGVISRSPTDLAPVLDAVARNASRLCGAANVSLYRVEGGLMHKVAEQGPPLTALGVGETRPITRTTISGRAIADRMTIHVPDYQSPDIAREYPDVRRDTGIRTTIGIPLLREGIAIGAFTAYRTESRPFSEREIALLQTFAAQAVIAIENVRLFTELEARNRELTESLEQQTATAEILRVISRSPTDVQPVFDAIAQSAVTLCEAVNGSVCRFDGTLIHLVAEHGVTPEESDANRVVFPRPPGRGSIVARSILTRGVVHVDVAKDPEYEHREIVQAGFRIVLSVPMLREGNPIGAITVTRQEGRPFTAKQIGLLQTFADQAVIAVENVRLFTELGARNRELTESLEQQTATGEILQVISSSPTDTRPVFDAIVRSAGRLGDAAVAMLLRLEGRMIVPEALEGMSEAEMDLHRHSGAREVAPDSVGGRVILTRRIVQIIDVKEDPEYAVVGPLALGYRTALGVPLLREGAAIGAIVLWRREVRPFAVKQIQLVRTFADQAVIAIENVRLFTELEARNRELTESLEQQTATSEILEVISRSPTEVQPIFDAIASNARILCSGKIGAVYRYQDGLIDVAAADGITDVALAQLRGRYPVRPDDGTLVGRSIRDRVIVQIPDLEEDPDVPPRVRESARIQGVRSQLVVPMLRDGEPIGAVAVARPGSGRFSENHVTLLQTFAAQAVIAIENARLFQELEARTRELARSVQELMALSDVGRAVSSTLDLPTVLATIVARAVELSGTSSGVLYEYDEGTQSFHIQASHQTEAEVVEALRASPIQLGEGATGRAVARRAPVEVVDLLEDQQFKPGLREVLTRLGYRSFLSIPLLLEQRILGALTVSRREPGSFPPETVNLLQTFATQSALAIQNARLFREIEAKGRELEVASRHKSQFLANMSHELRTPLNAVLGYTELLIDGIYGELSPKAGDVMIRIDRSGKHLLGLINDVLDLSKIEAGQLELALADYSLAEVVHAVVTQVESLAAEKGLSLQAVVAPGLPAGRGDERRLAQVLLNLVGNAIKFTEAGSVRIAAHREGDAFVVAVADTGPGIAEADRQRIFEEFQQADSSSTRKKGGTGLGLSIARRIVELHGGRIWVDSTVGRGSTFSFRVPVRVERQVARA